ncbi:MAG: DNA-binding response regulator [Microbacteriaceae bacterium]
MPAAADRVHRLAILDDHVLIVDGLAEWVRVNAADFEVITAVGLWSELAKSLKLRPDVVIMAPTFEPVSLETRVRCCTEAGAKVVIMSSVETAKLRDQAATAGASAFISKSRSAAEVVAAARRALDPNSAGDQPAEEHARPEPSITEADLSMLRLYASGYSTVDISLAQGVKFETVRAALKRVRHVYRAQNRQSETRIDLLRCVAEDGYLA